MATYGDGCGYAGGRTYSNGSGIRGRTYDVARGRMASGAAYAGGRMTSRADVRRRVGIPIPNVKLPYYPLYVLGGVVPKHSLFFENLHPYNFY